MTLCPTEGPTTLVKFTKGRLSRWTYSNHKKLLKAESLQAGGKREKTNLIHEECWESPSCPTDGVTWKESRKSLGAEMGSHWKKARNGGPQTWSCKEGDSTTTWMSLGADSFPVSTDRPSPANRRTLACREVLFREHRQAHSHFRPRDPLDNESRLF